MSADFVLLQPAWLALACIGLSATGFYLHTRRRARPAAAIARSGLVIAAGLLGVLVLSANDHGAAHLLLAAISILAAAILAIEMYRGRAAGLAAPAARMCGVARMVAWIAILAAIGRPAWQWTEVRWEKPLLVVLLDQSASMDIADRTGGGAERSRAAIANDTFRDAAAAIDALGRNYTVQIQSIGDGSRPLKSWRIAPTENVTSLAAALRAAGQARSAAGDSPAAALLVSDGAENTAETQVVLQSAAALARQETAVYACGVGPAPGATVSVLIDPLAVPAQIGTRDRLALTVSGHIMGCAGRSVRLDMLWNDDVIESRNFAVSQATEPLRESFELEAPGPGVHRLTARVTLPAALGGESFARSVVIDVRDDQLRVLYVAERPHSELAFVARALRADPRIELTQELLPGAPADGTDDAAARANLAWSEYDVVLLGDVAIDRFQPESLAALARAVSARGVGLMLIGGHRFFNGGDYARSPLGKISPVELVLRSAARRERPVIPTEAGIRHPLLQSVGVDPAAGERPQSIWSDLPDLVQRARFGPAKPLAVELATDGDGGTVLAVHEVGRGRCVAAAWDATWPWALASDQGLRVHRQFWRQTVIYLANRRPAAWVLTDKPTYVHSALQTGRERVRIRCGVSGLPQPQSHGPTAGWRVSLRLRRVATGADEPAAPTTSPASTRDDRDPIEIDAPGALDTLESWQVPLRRRRDEWIAQLPEDLTTLSWLAAGSFELEFSVTRAEDGAQSTSPGVSPLSARTSFSIEQVDIEKRKPTANLGLLRRAAARTEEIGGWYVGIEDFAELVEAIAKTDKRRRVEARVQYDPTRHAPWLLFAVAITALATEWVIRKRGGLP